MLLHGEFLILPTPTELTGQAILARLVVALPLNAALSAIPLKLQFQTEVGKACP